MRKFKALFALTLIAAAALLSGCGGGGASSPVGKGSMKMSIQVPRHLNTVYTYNYSGTADIGIQVLDYAKDATTTELGAADTVVTYSCTSVYDSTNQTSTEDCSMGGDNTFFITNIEPGSNYIVKVKMDETMTYEEQAARSAAGTASTYSYTDYVGALVDDVEDGVTSNVVINGRSTAVALAILRYAMIQNVAITDDAVITDEVKMAIEDAVDSLVGAGTIYLSEFACVYSAGYKAAAQYTQTCTDPFVPSNWTTQYTAMLDQIITEAGLGGGSAAPTVLSIYPYDGAIGVSPSETQFKTIFSESMDSSIDLNDPATLEASGFSITIASPGDTATTIDFLNAASYGTFSWSTTNVTNDTLIFSLLPDCGIIAVGGHLDPNTTQSIMAFTPPSNLLSVNGVAPDLSNAPTTSITFTTGNDTTAPMVCSFSPADGATGIAYNGTVFTIGFSEQMDSSVDLTNPDIVGASGFSVTVQNASTLSSLTIDGSNALSYGTFAWVSGSYGVLTLTYTLKSNSVLEGNGLSYLKSGTTYNITSFTPPSNITDQVGNTLDGSNLPSTGSFTTVSLL